MNSTQVGVMPAFNNFIDDADSTVNIRENCQEVNHVFRVWKKFDSSSGNNA